MYMSYGFIQLPNLSDLLWSHFIAEGVHAWIKTHVQLSQKIFGQFSILFQECLRHQVMNSALLSRYNLTNVRKVYIYIRYIQKVSRLKLHLPRQKWTMKEILIFFKIVLFEFSSFIPASFPLVKTPLKHLFDMIWSYAGTFLLMCLMSTSLTFDVNFKFRKLEKVKLAMSDENGGCFTYTIQCFTKILIKKILWLA